MNNFIYTDIHIFNKNGIELPLSYKSTLKLTIKSQAGDDAVYYGVLDNEYNIDFKQIKPGGRFLKPTDKDVPGNLSYAYTSGYLEMFDVSESPIFINDLECKYVKSLNSYSNDEYDITDILQYKNVKQLLIQNSKNNEIPVFPSLTFQTSVNFNEVSTSLVETESLYVLCKSDSNEFDKIGTSYNTNDFKYDILFFVDNRSQEEFKFFDVNDDELTWTNKIILDLSKNDFRVNIGFKAETEGLYEQDVYVCLVDKSNADNIYPIGAIKLNAEAIGEDERYRTLFANFNLPNPDSLHEVFNNVNNYDDNDDYITYNKNAKKLFLSYSEIFPYVGTYKALINAINVLGYTDIFFKEWYKELGESKEFDAGYVTYDMTYKSDSNLNTISNVSIEERVKLKKLSWISMFYKINKELTSETNDEYGFPISESVYGFNNFTILPKLISLKNWLEKYVIGVNCRIIDVGGEGIFFERYQIDTYGSYQESKEWNNNKNLAPSVDELETNNILIDSSTHISVDVSSNDAYKSLEDFNNTRFIDLIDGFIKNDGTYHGINNLNLDENVSNYIFTGSTIENENIFETYEIKASSKVNDFLFNDDYLFTPKHYEKIDSSIEFSSTLRLHDNVLKFSPYDLYKGYGQHSIFTKLPVIKIERANIRLKNIEWVNSLLYKIDVDLDNENTSYVITNQKTNSVIGKSKDYVNLIPPIYELSNDNLEITLNPWKVKTPTKFKRFTDYKFKSDNIFDDSYDGSTCTPVKTYSSDNTTFGLRYSNDNMYHLPMFLIRGYQFDNVLDDNNISVDSEYILEILDGKMIFRDEEHGRIVYLNFNFDTASNKQTIEVKFEYYSDNFSIVKYENAFTHFIEGKNYKSFYDNYLNNKLDDLIVYDTKHSIKVYNSGNFIVDVYATDMYNNIFAARCKNSVIVNTPDPKLITYSNVNSENSILVADDTELTSNFIDFCIYDTNYIIPEFSKIIIKGITYSQDSSILITYPTYSYSLETPKVGDYVNFINVKDRWKVIGLDSCFTNINTQQNEENDYENYSLVLKKYSYHNYIDVINDYDSDAIRLIYNEKIYKDDSSVLNATKYLYEDDNEYTFTNTNVIYYNELGGYPICQTYGQLANDKAFNIYDKSYPGNYKLAVKEQDDRSYMWGSLKELSKNNIINDITAIQKTVLSQIDIINVSDEINTQYENFGEFPTPPKYEFSSLFDNTSIKIINMLSNIKYLKSYDEISSELTTYFYETLNNINYVIDSFSNESIIANALNNNSESFKHPNDTYIVCDASLNLDKIFDLYDFTKNLYILNTDISNAIDSLINDSSISDIVNYYNYTYNIIKRSFIELGTEGNDNDKMSLIYDFILKRDLLNTSLTLENDNQKTLEQIILDYLKSEFILDESYVKAIIKTIFINLRLYTITDLNNYTNVLNDIFNVSFYKDVYSYLLKECKSLNKLFDNIDSFVLSIKNDEESDYKNITLEECISNIITCDNDYIPLRDKSKEFIELLNDLCNSINDVNGDDDTKLNSYVCLVYVIFVYISEQLITNIKNVLTSIVISKSENGIAYTCNISNLLSLFILATEPTLQMNLVPYVLASLEGQRYFLFKDTQINDLDVSVFKDITDELDTNNAAISLYNNFIKTHTMYNDMLINYISNENQSLVEKGYVTKGNISLMYPIDTQDIFYAYSSNEYELADIEDNLIYENDFDSSIEYKYSRVQDSLIYLKTSSYLNDGKKRVNDTYNENVMPNIKNILSNDYISLYTRPSWNIDVLVQELDDATISNIITNDTVLPEIDKENGISFYLITYVSTMYAPKLQSGDVIKISFKNLQTNDYYGAASYTIICKTTNKYMYIIAGKINEEFLFNIKDRNVWVPGNFYQTINSSGESIYLYDEEASKQFKTCSAKESQISSVETTIQNGAKKIKMLTNVKYVDMIDNTDNLSEDSFMYDVKLHKNKFYYVNDSSLENITDFDRYKIFVKQAYAVMDNSDMYIPITIKNETISERINMKMSYSNNMFVNHPMKISESMEDSFGITTLHIENSEKNQAYLDFIDNTYALTINKFDINEGLRGWMNYTQNNSKTPIPKIVSKDSSIYKSVNSSINVTQNNSYVCFALDDSVSNTSYVYWKVYRMIDNLNDHKFMFESYNPYLYLDYNDKGIYDIEAYTYDKFGNLNKHTYKGAYIVK